MTKSPRTKERLYIESLRWRNAAEQCASGEWLIDVAETASMRRRLIQHALMSKSEKQAVWTNQSRSLFCLFMQIECNEEAT